jgi:hypothetical protein
MPHNKYLVGSYGEKVDPQVEILESIGQDHSPISDSVF